MTDASITMTPAPRSGVRRAISPHITAIGLAVGSVAGIVNVLKGFTPTLAPGVEFYWRFSYRHGFIKRGFIGTLFSPALHVWPFTRVRTAIVVIHGLGCAAIIMLLGGLFASAIAREPRTDARAVLLLAWLCVMCSPMLPVLAHDTGYVDVYLLVIAFLAVRMILKQRYGAAAAIAAIGPLVHEGFVFVWAPVAILLAWSTVCDPADRLRKAATAAAPALLALTVNRLHSPAAVDQLLKEWPVSDGVKSAHAEFTFGQTLGSAFAHMRTYEFPDHWPNLLTACGYFLLPVALLLCAAAFCSSRRWRTPALTLVVATSAAVSPLMAIMLGWDLSRFLCWPIAGGAIVLASSNAPSLVPVRDDRE